MKKDTQIFEIIEKELNRQKHGLELIASENFVSSQVMEAVGSCLTNKYAEGLPGKRYYGGCQFVDESEQLAIDRACELFGAKWANVQPHSGASANAAVMLAILNPGDTIMGIDLSHGGHLTHGSPVNYSGKLYRPVFYGVEKSTGRVDKNMVEDVAKKEKPKLIICGGSSYARDWDYGFFRNIAESIGAVLMADIAHPAGLIASGLLNNPLPYCHVITTTTHKTLRGPRGGMILLGEDYLNPMGITTSTGLTKRMSTVLDSAVFPGMQGGPLEHIIAGKAVAFGEALEPEFTEYSKQVIKNAQAMANAFIDKNYQIITGGTDNHLMLIDLRNKNITGKEAEEALVKAEITLNKNMVPFDEQSPFVTSGIRIGTPAITTRGMKEDKMPEIVELIDKVIQNKNNENVLLEVKDKVKNLVSAFPLYI